MPLLHFFLTIFMAKTSRVGIILALTASFSLLCSSAALAATAKAKPVVVKPKTITGTVTDIEGLMLTVAAAKGAVYLVDASQARLAETADAPTLTVADMATGDKVKITGILTGTSMAAKTVSDTSLKGREYFYGTVTGVADDSISFNLNGNKYDNALIEATNAKLWRGVKKPVVITLRGVRLGEKLMVAGRMTDGIIAATGVWNLGKSGKR